MNVGNRSAFALTLFASLAMAGCAHEPPAPVVTERVIEVTATVEALDQRSRMVALRGPDGRRAAVYAGPGVQNFDQIKRGDQVTVSYYEAIGAAVTTPEQAAADDDGDEIALLRAAKGARPAAAVAETLQTTVTVDSVDTSLDTVNFHGSDGMPRMIAIKDPDAKIFIRNLKRGDLVQITYMEAVAVSVQPAARAGS
jgi:hypothetical protein